MSSHIHELWEALELPEQYPELDPERILARVDAALEQEERPRSTRTSMRRNIRSILILAAALILMTGTALAVASQLGVLELFFPHGDNSQLEPYVQTAIGSAENEDYRFTVNSALYDGQNVFAVVTVEALNDRAADDLMSNRADAEAHRETWGDEMAEHMLEDGISGPDTICFDFSVPGSLGLKELPRPSDISRSWQVDIGLDGYVGSSDGSLLLYAGIMGRDYGAEVPLDTVIQPIQLTPDEEVLANSMIGGKGILKSFSLTPVSYHYTLEQTGDWSALWAPYADRHSDAVLLEMSAPFFLRMKDGSVLTRSQLGISNRTFETPIDPGQVESIIFGDREFPADGSPSRPSAVDPHLYPFWIQQSPTDSAFQQQVSLEALCQALCASYSWDEAAQTATAVYRDVTVTAVLGSSTLYVDGQPVEMTWQDWEDPDLPEGTEAEELPCPASPSAQGKDLLVNIWPVANAWGLQACWDRTTDDRGVTHGHGWSVVP